MAQCIVPPIAAQVLPSSSQGDHVAPASRLLATIVQLFGADSVPSSSAGRWFQAASAHCNTTSRHGGHGGPNGDHEALARRVCVQALHLA